MQSHSFLAKIFFLISLLAELGKRNQPNKGECPGEGPSSMVSMSSQALPQIKQDTKRGRP